MYVFCIIISLLISQYYCLCIHSVFLSLYSFLNTTITSLYVLLSIHFSVCISQQIFYHKQGLQQYRPGEFCIFTFLHSFFYLSLSISTHFSISLCLFLLILLSLIVYFYSFFYLSHCLFLSFCLSLFISPPLSCCASSLQPLCSIIKIRILIMAGEIESRIDSGAKVGLANNSYILYRVFKRILKRICKPPSNPISHKEGRTTLCSRVVDINIYFLFFVNTPMMPIGRRGGGPTCSCCCCCYIGLVDPGPRQSLVSGRTHA